MTNRKLNLFRMVGPGVLVAATGVGAGDLATGAIAGSKLGVVVLWAVIVGAGLKYVLNEGLARWQLATQSTLLEGCIAHFGRTFQWAFAAYLLVWSFFVGSALMSACGITAHAMVSIATPKADKIIYGVIHSAAAVWLIRLGGYRLFEKIMSICIGLMFVIVIGTALALRPPWSDVLVGLTLPRIPHIQDDGLQWTIALMGGVGGTVTVLCYGYWIREEGRITAQDLQICRIDLAVGYAMTALFGLAMVIVGSQLGQVDAGGATLIVRLAGKLESELGAIGPVAKFGFLVGAWGAVFSSLLGVWQSVPYLFADFWRISYPTGQDRRPGVRVDTRSLPYRTYLWGISTLPVIGLLFDFTRIQKYYAVVGALFIPMLAAALLVLNRPNRVERRFGNSRTTTIVLSAALVFFVLAVMFEIRKVLFP